tara:strand:- start:1908 stop:2378 length:471 start_codon:yes stop_codon:yes gene_type:complete
MNIYCIFKKSDDSILTIHQSEADANKINTSCFSEIDTEIREVEGGTIEYMKVRRQFEKTHGFDMMCFWWEMTEMITYPGEPLLDADGNVAKDENGEILRSMESREKYPNLFNTFLQKSKIRAKMGTVGSAWPSLYVNAYVDITDQQWKNAISTSKI